MKAIARLSSFFLLSSMVCTEVRAEMPGPRTALSWDMHEPSLPDYVSLKIAFVLTLIITGILIAREAYKWQGSQQRNIHLLDWSAKVNSIVSLVLLVSVFGSSLYSGYSCAIHLQDSGRNDLIYMANKEISDRITHDYWKAIDTEQTQRKSIRGIPLESYAFFAPIVQHAIAHKQGTVREMKEPANNGEAESKWHYITLKVNPYQSVAFEVRDGKIESGFGGCNSTYALTIHYDQASLKLFEKFYPKN